MLALLLHTVIQIGLPASKFDVSSAAFVSNSRMAPFLTKPNSSLPSPYLILRLNSWLHAMSDGCVSLSAVSYGTLTYLKRQPLLHTKTTMDVRQRVMHRNLPQGHYILISNILLSVIACNATLSFSNKLTRLSILPVTSPKFYHAFFFIDMQIFS
jgi:hypothetical protein